MVAGLVVPDIVAAIVAKLRLDADLVALCMQRQPAGAAPRISASFPETDDDDHQWPMPHYAVIVRRVGGPGSDAELGTRLTRIDVLCYGPGATASIQARTADLLWRTLDPVLNPPPNMGISTAFHLANTEVIAVHGETDPIPGIEPGTNWRRVISSYVIQYAGRQLT